MTYEIDARADPIEAADKRGRELTETAHRATDARYDRPTGRVAIELTNGCTYLFPARLAQELSNATDDQLATIEVDGMGFNLHWPALEVDLYVPALVAGTFGTRAWMTRKLARHAGQTKSPAKAATSRANGAKGGRPQKSAQS